MTNRKKRWQILLVMCSLLTTGLFGGCGEKKTSYSQTGTEAEGVTEMEASADTQNTLAYMTSINKGEAEVIDDKYRTFYEVFLYSFSDSDGDGIGDIRGLIDKLDYINDGDDETDTDLGCNGIWLMPIMPSTTYHKYDVLDYQNIDAQYGTLDDFKELVEECHARGINLIIDLVMNHTSSEHPWFQAACDYIKSLNGAEPSEEECPYFGYYHFTREPKGDVYYEVGDTGWYYEAQFWSEMPDLNLSNEKVRNEFDTITSFWLDQGVDGFRLDAAGEYETGQNTKNVEILTWFNSMVKEKDDDAYIVAEVWQDLDTYSQYYTSGIDSCFDFTFGNANGIIASSVKKASGYDASSYGKALENVQSKFAEYNENYIDAPFYTNHDMARSAGYYSGDYSENMTKLSGAMNLFMSGNTFLYYGEELGMKGSGKDENKRAPMYWSDDPKDESMCKGPENMDTVKMKYGSLEEQKEDPDSVYHFYHEAIRLRNEYPAIARGTVSFEDEISNADICAIKKKYEDTELLMVYNISEKTATVDLSAETVNDHSADEMELGGVLVTTHDQVKLENGQLSLPPYSVAILK
ncbi:MAG: alpha-amylase family glycosyl hydrolase [Lachnospiraceae bacterium]|nr:alpha-amylase family glycosyl hydrolase [Lachnospiraceae bacterium]